ncbi:MAG: RNA ligase family protein [Nanoarchaeota archaeon]
METKVNEFLLNVAAISSTNAKKDILKQYKNDIVIIYVLERALNPFVTFGIQPAEIPEPNKENDQWLSDNFEQVKNLLTKLEKRELTGNNARNSVSELMNTPAATILSRILAKDLRCGIQSKTVNSVIKDLIPSFSCALAVDATEKIKYPVWGEPKLDGVRTLAVKDNFGTVTLFSRNGKEYDNFPNIKSMIERATINGVVLDGEVAGKTFDSVMNVAHRKSGSSKTDNDLMYNIFDIILYDDFQSGKSTTKQMERRALLTLNLFESQYIKIVEGKMLNNETEMMEYFRECKNRGYEGLVVKDTNAPYSFKRSDVWIKVKEMISVDGKVINIVEGKGKYSGTLGAIEVDIDNIKLSVGSGFTDDNRKEIWNNKNNLIGKMVEIQAQEKTKDGSYRFPVFLRWREDKD